MLEESWGGVSEEGRTRDNLVSPSGCPPGCLGHTGEPSLRATGKAKRDEEPARKG